MDEVKYLQDKIRNDSKWHFRYMKIAEDVSKWSSCLSRHVGCVITVGNRIAATGYNGAPSGIRSCAETGICLRKESKSGENLETCIAAHAEQNALMQAAKQGAAIDGGTMYCTTRPCTTCMKLIINSGIKRIFYIEDYPNALAEKLARSAGIQLYQISKEFMDEELKKINAS